MSEKIKEVIKQTYTNAIANTSSCCGPSCCSPEQEFTFNESYSGVKGYSKDADFGLGCGIPTEYAEIKEGHTVLDLGSGAGNDAFVARGIVGESGKVLGVDMTEAMIAKANENKRKLNYTNVEFLLGEIENMPIEDNIVDVVVSNCVMNLVPDKNKGFAEVFRVMKPGGHFSISDIVLNGDLPEEIKNAAEMYAGCVSGALLKDNYIQTIKEAGFENIQIRKEREIVLSDDILLKFINQEQLLNYRKSQSAISSVTVFAEKK